MDLDKPKSEGLEREIRQIEEELAKKKELLASQESASHEKETLREVYNEQFITADNLPPETSGESGHASPTPQTHASHSTVPLNAQQHKILQNLVNVAFSKGISEAIKRAQATNNPALIDALHDVLVDQLFDVLVERGVIKRF